MPGEMLCQPCDISPPVPLNLPYHLDRLVLWSQNGTASSRMA